MRQIVNTDIYRLEGPWSHLRDDELHKTGNLWAHRGCTGGVFVVYKLTGPGILPRHGPSR